MSLWNNTKWICIWSQCYGVLSAYRRSTWNNLCLFSVSFCYFESMIGNVDICMQEFLFGISSIMASHYSHCSIKLAHISSWGAKTLSTLSFFRGEKNVFHFIELITNIITCYRSAESLISNHLCENVTLWIFYDISRFIRHYL